MQRKTLIVIATLALVLVAVLSSYAYNEDIVASFDEQQVTVKTLQTYVDEVAGDNYRVWLKDRDGLRKLADFYINRTLLLEYAKLTIEKDNSVVNNHSVRSVDTDVMFLSSLLKKEVQDKVNVSDEDVHAYMNEKKMADEKLARQQLESERKNALMTQLVEKVREGHRIVYY